MGTVTSRAPEIDDDSSDLSVTMTGLLGRAISMGTGIRLSTNNHSTRTGISTSPSVSR